MADVGLTVGGAGGGASAPLPYTVPGAGEVILKGAYANLDGTAAGTFVPCLRIKTPNGAIMFTCIGSTVAAGGSATVTWFPGLGGGGSELEVTDNVTVVKPTTEIVIGSGLQLTSPAPGVAAALAANFGDIIHGRVSAGTTPSFVGTGWTGIRTGVGTYTISLSPPLASTPALLLSAYGDGANSANAASAVQNGSPPSGTSFTVTTWNPAVSVARDCGFDFIAIPTGGGGGGPHFPVQSNVIRDDTQYNAFPWVAYTQTGTLIMVYRSGTSHTSVNGKVTIQTSSDGGQTWSGQTTLFTPGAGHDYRDPSICLANTGRLVINTFDYDGTNALGIRTSVSDDNGGTWSALSSLITPYSATVERGVTSGACLLTQANTLIMPVYGQNTGDSSDRCGVLRSTDNGASWGSLINVSGANANLSEMTLIQFGNGTIRAYIRNNTNPAPIYTSDSTNDGVTWTAPAALGFNVYPGRPAAVLTAQSGTIFLMYRQPTTTYPAYRYSTDGGTTWSNEVAYSVTSFYEYAGGIARPGTDQLAMAVGIENTTNSAISYLLFFTWVVD